MFHLQEYLQGLDQLYAQARAGEAEAYLKDGLRQAARLGDGGDVLAILNELMGYYRAAGRMGELKICIGQSIGLAESLGLYGTAQYGTTLLNAATGLREAGEHEQAEELYSRAGQIFSETLEETDYRVAALHNNLSLLYAGTGRFEEAREELLKAMETVRGLEDSWAETAITCTNLGNLCFRMGRFKEGAEHMRRAVKLFEERPDYKDSHYSAALAGLGEAFFHEGRLKEAEAAYERALREIKRTYGENQYFQVTKANLETVQDLLKRQQARREGPSGLALSRAYYEAYGKPLLETKYPEYAGRIAAGLVGEGSECLGYDDELSTDHDYGPGFCLWLTKEDYAAIGQSLQADYEALPGEFMGFPARNTTREGAGRVGVFEIGSFLKGLTGHEKAPKDFSQWLSIPQEALCGLAAGAVFQDELGLFARRRLGFGAYPESVSWYLLSQALGNMAQAGQYNYGRARARGDLGGVYFSLARFLEAAVQAAYLLNGRYMPVYKWRLRGMEEFEVLGELKGMLEELMGADIRERDLSGEIEAVCRAVAEAFERRAGFRGEGCFLETYKKKAESLAAREREREEKGEWGPDREMVDRIVALEWKQFQAVENEGGRASCQDDAETFGIMRKSQYLTWDKETAESYLRDLEEAEERGWNLLTEKYARMMESTAPARYAALADSLPKREEKRLRAQEEILSCQINWARETAKAYPALAARGRRLFTREDTPWDTSMETYLRGELGTYSDRTIRLYGRMLGRLERQGKNLTQMDLEQMTGMYGYKSLEEAERRCAREAMGEES